MKRKPFLIIALFLLSGLYSFAQTYTILAKPAGGKDWGYANLKGEFFIEPKFRDCIGFSEEGLAAIYDGKLKKFYFINLQGETLPTEITDFKLIEVFGFGMKGFNDGLAAVKYKDLWGFLNTEGKLMVQATFEKVTPFNGGFASGQKGGKFYVIDGNGNETLLDIPGLEDVNEFSEGFAIFKTADDMVGFIDGNGKIAIPAKFKSAGDFSGGLAWAKDPTSSVGYIDVKGDWVVPPKFDAGKFYDPETGLARIKMGDQWAYTNNRGDLSFIKDTEIWEDFFSGLARGKKNGLFGFYNSNMEWVIMPQYDGARDFKNGYASVKKGDKWGIIDTAGNWVVEPKFEDIKDVVISK